MIGATKRWLRRNRKGLAIGVGVIGAGYLVGQYVLSKISDARERLSSERIARENLRRRFEQNQADCTFTVLALLPTAAENILDGLPVEELTQELQKKRAERLARLNSVDLQGSESSSAAPSVLDDDSQSLSSFHPDSFTQMAPMGEPMVDGDRRRPKRSKAQLWNDVKIASITRSFLLIYTLSLLALLTRIQLNLLGRRNYLSSVVSLASPPTDATTIRLEDHDDDDIGQVLGNDFETNRRYLTFSWWLLHRGWKDLMTRVEGAVKEVFGSWNPREDITLERLSLLTLEVRKKVEGSTEGERRNMRWLPYLLPPKEEENTVLQESGVLSSSAPSSPQTAATLRHLLDETSDLIESPLFSRILTLLNNEGFSILIDQKCATHAFKSMPISQPSGGQPESFSSAATIVPASTSSTSSTKLATVLAILTREAHSIGNGTNPPNEYLVAMEQGVRELEAFAAVVYSSNFDLEILPLELESATVPTIVGGSTPPSPTSGTGRKIDQQRDTYPVRLDPSPTLLRRQTEDPVFEKAWGKAAAASRNSSSNN